MIAFSCARLRVIIDACTCVAAQWYVTPCWVSCITLSYACARNSPMRLIVRSDGGHIHILFFVFDPPPWPVARNRATFCSSSCCACMAALCSVMVLSFVGVSRPRLFPGAGSKCHNISVLRYDLRTCALLYTRGTHTSRKFDHMGI